MENFQALEAPPPDPRASGGWELCPQLPASGAWGLRPQTLKTAPQLRTSGYAPARGYANDFAQSVDQTFRQV